MSKNNQMSFQLGGPIPEEDDEGSAPISVAGLNATPMKPKPKATMSSMGTGGGSDSDDDPMGRIP